MQHSSNILREITMFYSID